MISSRRRLGGSHGPIQLDKWKLDKSRKGASSELRDAATASAFFALIMILSNFSDRFAAMCR